MESITQLCRFCSIDGAVFLYNEYVHARWDLNPVNPAHALLLTNRHVTNFFDTTAIERIALMMLADEVKAIIEEYHGPAGYNIGINVGESAGQTIPHVHVHMIPRYLGDVADPRGGVRGVIPKRRVY